jgi:hypothetical protein
MYLLNPSTSYSQEFGEGKSLQNRKQALRGWVFEEEQIVPDEMDD